MTLVRVMPCLLLKGQGLVKTVRFRDPTYVGDPRNVVRIFNEFQVDEMILLDISATIEGRRPSFDLIGEVVGEAFMPVAYGGGLRRVEDAARVLALGVEKIVIGSAFFEVPGFVSEVARECGSQSVVVCLDVRRRFFGGYEVMVRNGTVGTGLCPAEAARRARDQGAGEILVQSMDRDGTMTGFDVSLIRIVADAVDVPVIACGGAGKLEDFRAAVREGGASAVAAGSLFVFEGRHRAVLVSYPKPSELRDLFD